MSKSSEDILSVQLTQILQSLLAQRLCTTQQVQTIWNKWHQLPQSMSIDKFLQQQGISEKVLRQMFVQTQPTEETNANKNLQDTMKDNVVAENKKLAMYLYEKGLVTEEILESLLLVCNKNFTHLGQNLVKEKHLDMTGLVASLRDLGVKESSKKDMGGLNCEQFGKYKILSEIARGGMGIVYKALQENSNRVVALKILLSGKIASKEQIHRFFREAKACASINHPNIIPVYDMGEEIGYHYFTMPYIEGSNFEILIEASDYLAENRQEAIDILQKCAEALAFAHDKNILHRDIKPSNILLDEENQPYITDFGLAKFLDNSSHFTQTGSALGTPFFMAPEQVKGDKSIDHRSDIYSLGVILYQILTEKLPFVAKHLPSLYMKIVNDLPVPPRNINPEISVVLQEICLKCLEKSPAMRYQNARELAQDLAQYSSGKKVIKLSLRRVFWRQWQQYKRSLLIYSVVVSFMVIVVVGCYQWYQNKIQLYQKIELNNKKLCHQAQKHLDLGEHKKALSALKKISSNFSQKSYAYLLVARSYQGMKKFAKAQIFFDKARKLAPGDLMVFYYNSAFCHSQDKNKKALELINFCIKEQPQVKFYRLRAAILQELQEVAKAREDVKKATILEKKQLQQQLNIIEKSLQQSQVGKALALLTQILKQNVDCETAYYQRAKIHFKRGEKVQALADISKAIELNASFKNIFLKATWLFKEGHLDQALKSFLEALKIADSALQKYKIRQKIAKIQFLLKKYTDAYQNYRFFLEKDKNNKNIQLQFAKSAFFLKKYQESLEHLKKISPNGETYYYQGLIYYKQKDYEQAFSLLQKSLLHTPPDISKLHKILGQIYFSRKEFKKAISHLVKASKNINNARLFLLLGDSYVEQKQFFKAIKAYSQCITLQPWIAKYYARRGVVFNKVKQNQKAEKDFFRASELEPENLHHLLGVYDAYFESTSIQKQEELGEVLMGLFSTVYHKISTDLFQKEKQKLIKNCISEFLQYRETTKSVRDISKYRVFVKALTQKSSPAVVEMAQMALLKVAYQTKILHEIRKKLKGAYSPGALKQLKSTYSKLYKKYIWHKKIEFKQLLSRYFIAQDTNIIKELYNREESNEILLQLLITPGNSIIRYFAAQALIDLRKISSYEILFAQTKSKDYTIRLLSTAVLLKNNFEAPTPKLLLETVSNKDPFLRTLAVRYLPKRFLKQLDMFSKDADIRVRLHVAKRLWETQASPFSEKLFTQSFSHTNPVVRLFSQAVFWDFEKSKELQAKEAMYTQKYLSFLIKGTSDKNSDVQRICIKRMATLKTVLVMDQLRHLAQQAKEMVRLQAIVSLGIKGDMESVIKITSDSKEQIIYRLPLLVVSKIRKAKINKLQIFPLMGQLLNEKDPRVLVPILKYVGTIGKNLGARYLSKHMDDANPYKRLGVLLGIMKSGTTELVPKIVNRLQDENILVRKAAATALIYIVLKNNDFTQLSQFHQMILRHPAEIQEGAAFGYARIFYKLTKLENIAGELKKWDPQMAYAKLLDRLISILSNRQRVHYKKKYKTMDPYSVYLLCLQKAVELAPNNAQYIFEKSIFHYLRKEYKKSVVGIRKAVSLRPQFAVYQMWLAKALVQLGNFKEASHTLKQVIQLRPFYFEAVELQALVEEKLGKKKSAMEISKRVKLLHVFKNR